jgi:Colicin V production protein
MIFNGGMSIWILAFLVIGAATLAGWRQGAIRAAFAFVGILFAWLLAVPVGKLVHPILPHIGASNPVFAWALAPIVGFLIVSIVFAVAAQPVHKKVEHFYKYTAGDLRLALWERLNTRLGICVGVLNGALYFVLITFLVFNLGYWTTQFNGSKIQQPATIRLSSQLWKDLDNSGISRTACAVGTLQTNFYQLADLTGLIIQQKDTNFVDRLIEYPAFTSLWERDDFQPLKSDPTVTNALTSGVSLGELLSDPEVLNFLRNKEQRDLVVGILLTNMNDPKYGNDLTNYLLTGKSAKYDGQKIIGHWEFNPAVTIAWLRQGRPKMPASEMRVIRAMWSEAYSNTLILATGDNQLFVKNLPRFEKQPQPGQPFFHPESWKGDWATNANNGYDLHIALNGEDKFMSGTAEDLRLTIKDGKSLMIFDRAD